MNIHFVLACGCYKAVKYKGLDNFENGLFSMFIFPPAMIVDLIYYHVGFISLLIPYGLGLMEFLSLPKLLHIAFNDQPKYIEYEHC